MSHAAGAVKFPDGEIYHYEYNGTADVVVPHLYKTFDEMRDNWRRPDFWKECEVGEHNREPVEIATTYGSGFYWYGVACKECMCITAGFEPDYSPDRDELPSWYPRMEK